MQFFDHTADFGNAGSVARQWLLPTLSIATACYLLGRFALMLAEPPGYAAPLWPVAGINMAAVILIGKRALPGILLGALAVTLSTEGFQQGAPVTNVIPGITPMIIAEVIQPFIGIWLLQRFMKTDRILHDVASILRFILMVLVICLVTPSISVGALFLAGEVPVEHIGNAWITWYCGHIFGMILFTPLVLIACQLPARDALILTAILATVLLGIYEAGKYLKKEAGIDWIEHAQSDTRRISRLIMLNFDREFHKLESLALLYRSSEEVTEEEFLSAINDLTENSRNAAFVAAAVLQRESRDKWIIENQTTDFSDLTDNQNLMQVDGARQSIVGALNNNGRVYAGPDVQQGSGGIYAFGSLFIADTETPRLLAGIVYINRVLARNNWNEVPAGLVLRAGRPSVDGSSAVEDIYFNARDADRITAAADFTISMQGNTTQRDFHWIVEPGYRGGPDLGLARTILVSGTALDALIVLFLGFVMTQKNRITAEVQRRSGELRESEERYSSMFNASTDGIQLYDAEGNLMAVNDAMCRMVGYTREEILDGSPDMFVHPDSYGALEEFRSAIAENRDFRCEGRNLAKDGSIIEVDARAVPFNYGGARHMFCVVRDITAQKKLEVELREAKEEAQAGEYAKASFLATMSHEIRTPMSGVISMVQLLQQTELDDDQKSMLNTIAESGRSLLAIINDILDFSKLEAGKLVIEEMPFSPTDILEGSAAIMAPTAGEKNIRLVCYADPVLPASVLGDPVRIRQILINLIGNAVKFSSDNDVIISAEPADRKDDGIEIRFSVTDKGIGISPALQKTLFVPFTQGESATSGKYGGTGLGLSICQRLTEMMDGHIGLESEAGKGTTFHVTLPFRITETPAPVEKGVTLDGLQVLLAMQDEIQADICRQYLEFWHAEVITLQNPHDPDSILDQSRSRGKSFDVVVTDQRGAFAKPESFLRKESTPGVRTVIIDPEQRERMKLSDADISIQGNPLRRALLVSAIAVSCGRESPEIEHMEEADDMITTVNLPTIEEARQQGTLILVAEDNATNREVIMRQLNLLGYACEMAEDGRQALEKWQSNKYALVLTDCHMPEMDGFELTDAIRAEGTGTTHVPVIAVTANALYGEAERCLEAGMDDYLSKPIDLKQLKDKLRHWIPQYVPSEITTATTPVHTDSPVNGGGSSHEIAPPLEPSTLISIFGENPDDIRRILDTFVVSSREIINEIRSGWAQNRIKAVEQGAHKLKSAARTVGADQLVDVCLGLELISDDIDREFINLQVERLRPLLAEIEQYVETMP